jgi:pheromone shutdown-related protein TraB
MARITIVGTSHIAPASIEAAKKTILRLKPDCVAIELDPERYAALKSKRREKASLRNPMYFVLNNLQTHLGHRTGMLPGSEMLTAVETARSVNARIVLIDMDIAEIMGRLGAISRWEKFKLVFKLLMGMIPWPGNEEIDLEKVPPERVIEQALNWMHKELPDIYNVLITDRNAYMADWVRELSKQYKNIVVVVGAGHKHGLERLLRQKPKKVRRRKR